MTYTALYARIDKYDHLLLNRQMVRLTRKCHHCPRLNISRYIETILHVQLLLSNTVHELTSKM